MLRTLYAIEESFLEVFESDLLDEDIEAYQDTLEALTGEADEKLKNVAAYIVNLKANGNQSWAVLIPQETIIFK